MSINFSQANLVHVQYLSNIYWFILLLIITLPISENTLLCKLNWRIPDEDFMHLQIWVTFSVYPILIWIEINWYLVGTLELTGYELGLGNYFYPINASVKLTFLFQRSLLLWLGRWQNWTYLQKGFHRDILCWNLTRKLRYCRQTALFKLVIVSIFIDNLSSQ